LRQSEAPNPGTATSRRCRCFAVHAALIIRVRGRQDHLDNPGISLRQQVIDVPVQSLRASHMSQHPCAQAARGTPGVDIRALGEVDHAERSNHHLHGPTQLDPQLIHARIRPRVECGCERRPSFRLRCSFSHTHRTPNTRRTHERVVSTDLTDYILSGHAYLHAHTPEKTRFVQELKESPRSCRPTAGRSSSGRRRSAGRTRRAPRPRPSGAELGPPNPQTAPQQILELPEEALFVLKDFGCYLQSRTFAYFDVVLAWLSEIRDVLAHTGRTVIFVGVDFEIPPALQHDVTTIEFKLPDDEAIEKAVRYIGEDHPIDEAFMPALVTACRGMTQQQVEDRVALALRKFKKLNGEAARLILNEKAEVIRRTGLLDYRDPPSRRPGPHRRLGKRQAARPARQAVLRPDARDFGIEFPRGLLLVGISGGGKTQMSLCIASYLGLPLIQLDVGSLMSKWVGESERNMREAIRLLEGLGSCVLQLDEIEKGFGGVGGEMDGGSAQRSFGIFLKWLSDRSCPVYVVATANNIRALPVEFTRKGRFDELYGVYLPTHAERQEIFGIHLRLRKREPEQFDLDALARKTEGYTGADIKEVVQLGLKLAFHAGAGADNDHLLAAIPEIRPLSKTDPESVTEVTKWLDSHTKPAGNGHIPCSRSTATRSSGA
jgi:AAA+ superfamily predicted ATPase